MFKSPRKFLFCSSTAKSVISIRFNLEETLANLRIKNTLKSTKQLSAWVVNLCLDFSEKINCAYSLSYCFGLSGFSGYPACPKPSSFSIWLLSYPSSSFESMKLGSIFSLPSKNRSARHDDQRLYDLLHDGWGQWLQEHWKRPQCSHYSQDFLPVLKIYRLRAPASS